MRQGMAVAGAPGPIAAGTQYLVTTDGRNRLVSMEAKAGRQ
jgi:hypothetical protein